MGIINAVRNQNDADMFGEFLTAAKNGCNPDVKDHIFPRYMACGGGWEPAILDATLVEFFKSV